METLWLPSNKSIPYPTPPKAPQIFNIDLLPMYQDLIDKNKSEENPDQFRIYNNDSIPTYPPYMILPNISDHTVKCILPFRSNQRIPCINYLHKNIPLARSAQPKTGLTNTRNHQDEHLIHLILYKELNYIIDARPKINVQVNQLKGMGSESHHYKGSIRIYLGIDNIHVMRDSYSDLISHLTSINLNMSWFHHLSKILRGSALIVYAMDTQSIPCLIHCSDGWDRTPQLSALTILCLNSEYRTLEGLSKLVEVEFGFYSHKFKDRLGYTEYEKDLKESSTNVLRSTMKSFNSQQSPIMLQFYWCVYLLQQKHPRAFNFKAECLIRMVECLYLGYRETLGNRCSQRPDSDKCGSMFDDVLEHAKNNDLVGEITDFSVLDPGKCDMKMWAELYIANGFSVNHTGLKEVMSYPMNISN
eukprot:NODE_662_length_4925_cov_0.478243.p1 type:complete len:416 gc:universal NODE_662_length_4925_cov_0.478243:1199-2446(+)